MFDCPHCEVLQLVQAVEQKFESRIEIAISASAIVVKWILRVFLSILRIPQLNRGHRATQVDFVRIKLVAKSMRNYRHQVRSLTQGCVYFFPFYISELLDAPQSETAYRSILIHRRNVEHLVNEVSPPQSFILLHEVVRLPVQLLLGL